MLRLLRALEALGADLRRLAASSTSSTGRAVGRPSSDAADARLGRRSSSASSSLLLDLDLEVEQEADRLLLDAVHHRGEHVEALALVLDQRVALGVGPQVDALAQVVHLVEVLAPLAVEHREHDAPLELAHDLGADLRLAAVVRRVRVVLERLDQLVAVEAGAAAGLLLERVEVERHRVELAQRGPQRRRGPTPRRSPRWRR